MNTNPDDLVALQMAELQAVNDQLRKELAASQAQKMETVAQLASGLAHDLNNILAVVQGNASLLLANKPSGGKEAKSLESISAAVDRATKLVRQLLTLSRRQLPELSPINLRDTLASVSGTFPHVLTPDINVEIQSGADLPNVSADPGMMEILLTNLVLNARDAMPEGGRLRISIDAVDVSAGAAAVDPDARPGRFVRLTVADSGSGISPENLAHIFEPFFSTKPVGKGTGLGLTTVYGIARQHRGWVEVQSKVNGGSAFQVYIPAAVPARTAQKHAPSKPAGSSVGGETILVVEDEPDLMDLVTQILESSGYRVVSASSGPEALEAWAKHRGEVRLLLTDLMLPEGFSGRELAQRLTAENPRLRVIFTSGFSAGMPGTELANVDTRQFLAKPYRPTALIEIVRRCLDEPLPQVAGATT